MHFKNTRYGSHGLKDRSRSRNPLLLSPLHLHLLKDVPLTHHWRSITTASTPKGKMWRKFYSERRPATSTIQTSVWRPENGGMRMIRQWSTTLPCWLAEPLPTTPTTRIKKSRRANWTNLPRSTTGLTLRQQEITLSCPRRRRRHRTYQSAHSFPKRQMDLLHMGQHKQRRQESPRPRPRTKPSKI